MVFEIATLLFHPSKQSKSTRFTVCGDTPTLCSIINCPNCSPSIRMISGSMT
jgi:hypothetical protein